MANPIVDLDLKPLEDLTKTLADGPRRLALISLDVMRRGGRRAANRARELATGETLRVRSGTYRRSLDSKTDRDGDVITTRVGVLRGEEALRYARIHEYGGTITPKRARLLTVPLSAALTAAGVQRFTAREAADIYKGGTFWKTISAGGGGIPILFGKKTEKSRTITPLFVGLKRATIRPTRTIQRSVDETVPSIREELKARVIAAIFTEAGPTGAIPND